MELQNPNSDYYERTVAKANITTGLSVICVYAI